MFNNLLQINPAEEEKKIIQFLQSTFADQKIEKAVIGVSGGIDSATSLALLAKAIPKKNITVLHLPYFEEDDDIEELVNFVGLSKDQVINISIEDMVDDIVDELDVPEQELLRRGNIGTRIRMIILYDFAKKNNALAIGTENRSEYHLGYFTRFGDEASDIEPIQHLYKTQIYELAKHLGIPSSILSKKPSAGLWEGQTDEEEFGFSYKEADPVLYLFYDKKNPLWEIKNMYPNAEKIIKFAEKNSYKHKVPYSLASSY